MIFGRETSAYKQGMEEVERRDRVRAFGAIRRSAEIAREHDRQAELYRDDEWEPSATFEELQCARAIRSAIRAAIGSEKT